MAAVFCWVGIVVGLVGYIACKLECFRNKQINLKKPLNALFLITSAVTLIITLAVWLVARQKFPPFSNGQTLAVGFLIGGIASFLFFAIKEVFKSKFAVLFFSLLISSIVFKFNSGYPQEALFGFLSAFLASAFLYRFAAKIKDDNLVILTSLIPISIILGVYHFDNSTGREFWSLPILLSSFLLIATYIGSKIKIPKLSEEISSIAFSAVLYLIAAAAAGFKGVHDPRVFWVSLISIISGIFCYIISKSDFDKPISKASVMALLIIALSSAAFTIWGGYGIAIALIAFLAVLIPTEDTQISAVLKNIAYLMLSIAILKIYSDAWREDNNPVKLKSHYGILGIIIGAIIPYIIVESIKPTEEIKKSIMNLLWLIYIGAVLMFGVLAVFLIWGNGIVDGLIVGSIIACAFNIILQKEFKDSIGMLAISIQLLLFKVVEQKFIQELDRTHQIIMLGILAVLIAIPVLIGWGIDYKEMRRQK